MKTRLAILLVILTGATSQGQAQPAVDATKEKHVPVVRVHVTNQPYDFFHPWTKRAPFSRRALGVVLAGNRVLVTAEMVANLTYLELEKAESGEKVTAEVAVVDYEANLALLKPADEKFLEGIKPLTLTDAHVGDRVSVWQLESTGAVLITSALITTIDVARYPVEETALLTYHSTASLQYRDGSFTVPLIKENKLTGLMMRYDTRTQNLDAIPAPVIAHFLKEAAKPAYQGFPRAGLLFSPLRDPQLRRHARLKGDVTGGVYVTQVQKGSPAGLAGIQEGDVLLAVADKPIDQDGNYSDKLYSKISLVHLISGKFHGETVKFRISRDGQILNFDVTLTHRPAADYLIEPYTFDRAPRYHLVGGVVLQELSRQYLKEWGDWQKKAPERFVYFDRYQAELFSADPRRKLVILSHVLPSASTVGYEELAYLVVTKINDVPLLSLDEVPAALSRPINGFHKFEFEENPRVIYLDAAQVKAEEPELLKNYGLPAVSALE
jgi:S1-C subfamily serine protease